MSNGIDQDARQLADANALYWGSDESVNRIADRLGLSKGSLYAAIKPKPSDSMCPTCGGQLAYPNRTALERGTLSCAGCNHEFTVRGDRAGRPIAGPVTTSPLTTAPLTTAPGTSTPRTAATPATAAAGAAMIADASAAQASTADTSGDSAADSSVTRGDAHIPDGANVPGGLATSHPSVSPRWLLGATLFAVGTGLLLSSLTRRK